MGHIRVSALGKAYKQYPSRWSRLAEWMLPFSGVRHELKWVLQDIGFTIEPGEAVGILGVNGAGKSTLLKLITGTIQATTGEVDVGGRVAALLELGMGFHPDFTGRQNVFMAGQLIGFTTEEIAAFMPQVEAFAEIGEYIDQPVRIYSSGMQVRLAFSLATAVRPDILIVDEALSVGDAAFQRKCFQRIEAFLAAGTTLLLVSHSAETVKKLCSRALYLRNGLLVNFAGAKLVCDEYEKDLFGSRNNRSHSQSKSTAFIDHTLTTGSIEQNYGGEHGRIIRIRIENNQGLPVNVIPEGDPFSIGYDVDFYADSMETHFGMMLKTVDGVCVYAVNTDNFSYRKSFSTGEKVCVMFSLSNNLAPGTYYVNCGVTQLADHERAYLHRRLDAAIIRVTKAGDTEHHGLANLQASISISTL